MKNIIYLFISGILLSIFACTSDFEKINTNPNAITPEEASARYFITKAEYKLYAPSRYYYWRANLIHADRFAGYFCFGNHGSWWNDELGYKFHGGYTQASWEMYGSYFNFINTYLKLTEPGGDFENELSHAVGVILQSLYYQQYTDVFGNVPYSEAGDPTVLLPKFDAQKDIYKGLIDALTGAVNTIGDATKTGEGVEDLGENDILFKGDLQKWKAFANSLKLRIAMRALGAPGADFAQAAVKEALNGPLLETEDALVDKDNGINQYNSSSYGDIWIRFGGLGSKWKVSQTLINYLQKNQDPRLGAYAEPAPGGEVTISRPAKDKDSLGWALFPKRLDYIKSVLDDAGAQYTVQENDLDYTITMAENTYYVGQPTRLNGFVKPLARFEFFSNPSKSIIGMDPDDDNINAEIVLTSAEVYFNRAEAILRGLASGDAQSMYENGLRAAMKLYKIDDASIDQFIASSPMGKLKGSQEEMLEQINVQKWIANYTEGFEGWATVRKSGFPKELANGVSDIDIYGLGDINGAYPTRMQYGPKSYDLNGASVEAANAAQGPDQMDTKLWWQK